MPTLRNKPPKGKSHQFKFNPFYRTIDWRRTRGRYLKANPLCEQCGKPGKSVDHMTPIRLGGHPTDHKNLMTLCKPCHNSKSARDGNKFRKKYNKTKTLPP